MMEHPNPKNPIKDFSKCGNCHRLNKCWYIWNGEVPVRSYKIPDDCDMKTEYLVDAWNK